MAGVWFEETGVWTVMEIGFKGSILTQAMLGQPLDIEGRREMYKGHLTIRLCKVVSRG